MDYERPAKPDWKYEQYMRGSVRPIHRYDRVKRFESTLYQILGLRGNVDLQTVLDLRIHGYDKRPGHVWDSIRNFLKKNHKRKYYNRISSIIQMLKLPFKLIPPESRKLQFIVNEFRKLNNQFQLLHLDRKYFINLRFIVLKLLQQYSVVIEYDIPLVRTKRKLKPLEEVWSLLNLSLPK